MIKPSLPVLALMITLVSLISCKEQKNRADLPVATGQFNFGVLRYDSVALEYRLDSVHNRGLVLQFMANNAADANSAFQLIAYAYDTLNDHNNSWMPDTLRLIRDSLPVNFSGNITIGNNEITREQLFNVVRDAEGKRFSYDYVVFTPVVEGVFNHVVYMLHPVKDNKPVQGAKKQMTSPMPPARNWALW